MLSSPTLVFNSLIISSVEDDKEDVSIILQKCFLCSLSIDEKIVSLEEIAELFLNSATL